MSGQINNETTDSDLITAYVAGNELAFTILYNRYRVCIRVFIVKLWRHKDVDDLLQETFAKAALKLDQLKDHSLFRSWLFRIAYACVLDQTKHRRRKKLIPFTDIMAFQGSEDSDQVDNCNSTEVVPRVYDPVNMLLETGITEGELWGLVDSLPEIYSRVLKMRFKDGLELTQIVAIEEITHTAVRARIERGTRRLSKLIKAA